jgi:hypothetical protein
MPATLRHNNQAIKKTGFSGRETGAGDNGRDPGQDRRNGLTI